MNDREQWRIDAEEEWKAERLRLKKRGAEKRRKLRKKKHDGKEKFSREKAIVEMHRLGFETGDTISAYECEFCDAWHVGNSNKIFEVERVEALGFTESKKRSKKKPPMTQVVGELYKEELSKLLEEMEPVNGE